ncbi:hypothetical protein BZA77DRAFT_294064 [Pyronema omphalodes]|nr:hypothetical protein BZA77DRAFT_294064 [Pyronema omphalodes]
MGNTTSKLSPLRKEPNNPTETKTRKPSKLKIFFKLFHQKPQDPPEHITVQIQLPAIIITPPSARPSNTNIRASVRDVFPQMREAALRLGEREAGGSGRGGIGYGSEGIREGGMRMAGYTWSSPPVTTPRPLPPPPLPSMSRFAGDGDGDGRNILSRVSGQNGQLGYLGYHGESTAPVAGSQASRTIGEPLNLSDPEEHGLNNCLNINPNTTNSNINASINSNINSSTNSSTNANINANTNSNTNANTTSASTNANINTDPNPDSSPSDVQITKKPVNPLDYLEGPGLHARRYPTIDSVLMEYEAMRKLH